MSESTQKPGRIALFRARHPHVSRAIRNTVLTGAVAGALAMGARRNFRHAAELGRDGATALHMNKGAIKQALARGKMFHKASIYTGVGGAVLGVGNPLERWDYERRQRNAATKRAPRVTQVVTRRRGASTTHRKLYL